MGVCPGAPLPYPTPPPLIVSDQLVAKGIVRAYVQIRGPPLVKSPLFRLSNPHCKKRRSRAILSPGVSWIPAWCICDYIPGGGGGGGLPDNDLEACQIMSEKRLSSVSGECHSSDILWSA